jgi:hypothetical protein
LEVARKDSEKLLANVKLDARQPVDSGGLFGGDAAAPEVPAAPGQSDEDDQKTEERLLLRLRKLFDQIQSNGAVTKGDLFGFYRKSGVDVGDGDYGNEKNRVLLEAQFARMDADCDGIISFDEFAMSQLPAMKKKLEERRRARKSL